MPGEVGPAWGRRGAPVSPAGQWPGRDLNGPLRCSRRGCRGPDRRKRARRRGVGVPERCVLNLRWDPSPRHRGPAGRSPGESDGPSCRGEARSSGGAVAAGVRPPGGGADREVVPGTGGTARAAAVSPSLGCLRRNLGDPSTRLRARPPGTPGALSSVPTRAPLFGPAHAGRPR